MKVMKEFRGCGRLESRTHRGAIVMALAHRARQDQGILINVSPAFICHSSVCDPLPETSFGRIIMAAAVKTPWTFGSKLD